MQQRVADQAGDATAVQSLPFLEHGFEPCHDEVCPHRSESIVGQCSSGPA